MMVRRRLGDFVGAERGHPYAQPGQVTAVAFGLISSEYTGPLTVTRALLPRSAGERWQTTVPAFAADHPLAILTSTNHTVLGVVAAHAIASTCALLGSLHLYTTVRGVRCLRRLPADVPLSVRTTIRQAAPHRRGVLVAVERAVHLTRFHDSHLANITDVLLLRAPASVREEVSAAVGDRWLGLRIIATDEMLPKVPTLPEETTPMAPLLLDGAWGGRYASLSGDSNPIHTSRIAAWLAGLGAKPIAHGMSIVRAVWSAAAVPVDADSFAAWFTKPIPFPDASVAVTRSSSDRDFFVAGRAVVVRITSILPSLTG